ncbi:MAG: hypothetical protein IT303_14930 [Dehalococcoidia bacterium]|nr:hypothetical protein [Dehalococcoidia bacterium]
MTGTSAPFFIVNPMSGGGRTERRIPKLLAAMERAGFAPDAVQTEHQWHGYELARKAIEDGRETLVACGGDGTVYELANAIIDLGAADRVRLGTVPMGTGKDVAKCLGIGRPALALQALRHGTERRIDAGRIECFDPDGAPIVRHFLLAASAGWIPEISHSVPTPLKRLGDTSPYVIMAFVKMVGPMNRGFEVGIDGEELHGSYNSISVHNMELWGGDLLVAPGAAPDDGQLDVVRWGPLARPAVLKAIQGQRAGGAHLEMEGIDRHAATRVVLAADRPTQVDLDGEDGAYLPGTITVVPGAIRFIAPLPGPGGLDT